MVPAVFPEGPEVMMRSGKSIKEKSGQEVDFPWRVG